MSKFDPTYEQVTERLEQKPFGNPSEELKFEAMQNEIDSLRLMSERSHNRDIVRVVDLIEALFEEIKK